MVVAIAGAKTDLESKRVVSRDAVESFASGLTGFKEVLVRECSSKTGEGVQELFEAVCVSLISNTVIENGNC